MLRHLFFSRNFSFFFFFYIFFYFTLQYCISFAIHQHNSTTGVHEFPNMNPAPSPYHLFGSSQCTIPKHPVSCIEPRQAIHFLHDIIHVSIPFSQIIPPSPPLPLPQSQKVCFIHLCLFCCLTSRVIVTIFLNSIYMC